MNLNVTDFKKCQLIAFEYKGLKLFNHIFYTNFDIQYYKCLGDFYILKIIRISNLNIQILISK